MIDLLQWLAERPRTYADTIDVWKSSCPRLMHWEDAIADGLVRISKGHVELTEAGEAAISPPRAKTEGLSERPKRMGMRSTPIRP